MNKVTDLIYNTYNYNIIPFLYEEGFIKVHDSEVFNPNYSFNEFYRCVQDDYIFEFVSFGNLEYVRDEKTKNDWEITYKSANDKKYVPDFYQMRITTWLQEKNKSRYNKACLLIDFNQDMLLGFGRLENVLFVKDRLIELREAFENEFSPELYTRKLKNK